MGNPGLEGGTFLQGLDTLEHLAFELSQSGFRERSFFQIHQGEVGFPEAHRLHSVSLVEALLQGNPGLEGKVARYFHIVLGVKPHAAVSVKALLGEKAVKVAVEGLGRFLCPLWCERSKKRARAWGSSTP